MSTSVVNRVKAFPGKTAAELQTSDEKKTSTRWALFNARKAGQIKQGETKRCSVTGRRAATWFPVIVSQSRFAPNSLWPVSAVSDSDE